MHSCHHWLDCKLLFFGIVQLFVSAQRNFSQAKSKWTLWRQLSDWLHSYAVGLCSSYTRHPLLLHCATCYRRHWSAEIAVLHGTGLCAASPHQAIITTLHQVFSAVPSKMTKDDKMQHQLYVPFSQITLQIQRSAEFARLSFSAHSLLVFHICFVRNTKPFLESSQP